MLFFAWGVLDLIVSDVKKIFLRNYKAVSFKYLPRDSNKANFRKFFSKVL